METIAAGSEPKATSEISTRGPIIAATDGMKQSGGALALARSLAAAMGSSVQVVAVQRSIALIVPDPSLLVEPSVLTRLTAELRNRVRLQCAEASAEGSGPGLAEPEIVSGEPERVITRLAASRHSPLIVVGLGRHEVLDRIFGSETALKIARISKVPVLAVPAEVRGAPRRAVVGLDFSEASLHAAQAALNLLAAGGVLHLVHVTPRDRLRLDPWISDREYDDIVRHRFARFRARLIVPPNVTIEQTTCSGDAARELIAHAQRQDADVIAAGSHGHGFVSRLVIGSVTTALLRAAKTAVLVVPPDAQSLAAAIIGETNGTVHIDRAQWSTVLADFTRTNAGRRTRLEIDDPEMGAQAQEMDYPLRGVAFDPNDQRLEIMLGTIGAGEPHLSRNISSVSSLDLLTDKDGTDVALRVRHGTGQTILSFVST